MPSNTGVALRHSETGHEATSREDQKERKKLFVVGASGHARVVLDILDREGSYEIAGLLDDRRPVGSACSGYMVLGTTADLPDLLGRFAVSSVVVAIGDNWSRARVVNQIRNQQPGIEFVTAIHPNAVLAHDVGVGQGSVIMAGVVVNSSARVGEFCILNTRSSLDHDSVMDAFSSLGPAAVIGGGVHVGAFSKIAIGATVAHDMVIGKHTVVGAGALVVKSIPDEVVAYGIPARIIRPRKPGDWSQTDLADTKEKELPREL